MFSWGNIPCRPDGQRCFVCDRRGFETSHQKMTAIPHPVCWGNRLLHANTFTAHWHGDGLMLGWRLRLCSAIENTPCRSRLPLVLFCCFPPLETAAPWCWPALSLASTNYLTCDRASRLRLQQTRHQIRWRPSPNIEISRRRLGDTIDLCHWSMWRLVEYISLTNALRTLCISGSDSRLLIMLIEL